ncbi:MAG: hypothetical protein Tsb0034_26360 [Ekhidna sp.]
MTQLNWTLLIVAGSFLATVLLLIRNRRGNTSKSKEILNDEDRELHEIYLLSVSHIKEHKYFLNKSMKLSELAKTLSCNERQLSRAINKHGNGNFNKFINSFRVEYSKELLSGGEFDHYTIEAIAEESGFANKVSFYNAFKSETGLSPTKFRTIKQS